MSDFKPTEPYVYQPIGAVNAPPDGRIFGLAGPGAESLRDQRFTRAEAELELAKLLGR